LAQIANLDAKFAILSGWLELIAVLSTKFAILSESQREADEISNTFAKSVRYLP